MREIKFRGRSTHSDDWCYGSFINNPDEPTICGFDIWADGDSDWREEKVEPHTVGQFTGLKDKNGKEIYEGDIILRMYEIEVGKGKNRHIESGLVANDTPKVIDFRNGAFGYVNSSGEAYLLYEEWLPLLDELCEVIGNIYDDPELKKGCE